MPSMLSSLPRSQGARPVVQLLGSSGVGSPRSRSPVCLPANGWPQQQNDAVFAVSRAEGRTASCHDARCCCCNCSRVHRSATRLGAARALESGVARVTARGNERGGRSVMIGQEARPRGASATTVVVQVGRSDRGMAVQSEGRSPSSLGRGHTPWRQRKQQQRQGLVQHQQQRAYSSKDGFGGGQHFPHSDQV